MENQVEFFRKALREKVITLRRAKNRLRKSNSDLFFHHVGICSDAADDLQTCKDFCRSIEWYTGLFILSETRAQARREGKRVN